MCNASAQPDCSYTETLNSSVSMREFRSIRVQTPRKLFVSCNKNKMHINTPKSEIQKSTPPQFFWLRPCPCPFVCPLAPLYSSSPPPAFSEAPLPLAARRGSNNRLKVDFLHRGFPSGLAISVEVLVKQKQMLRWRRKSLCPGAFWLVLAPRCHRWCAKTLPHLSRT